MSKTQFNCPRCGTEFHFLSVFKKHLERKRECNPKESEMSLTDVKVQFQSLLEKEKRSISPTTPERKKKKRKLRNFGDETRDYIKRDWLNGYISDPLKGLQAIIQEIYFNPEHEENHTVRLLEGEQNNVEIHQEENWVKVSKSKIYDRMIYRATDILENNTSKGNWSEEFRNFVISMGEMDNDELLVLIREEVDHTMITALRRQSA